MAVKCRIRSRRANTGQANPTTRERALAEPAVAAHAELHDGYEQGLSTIARLECTTVQRPTQELCAWVDALERALAGVRNATNKPVLAFVLGAKARWAWKDWEAPNAQLALLAGSVPLRRLIERHARKGPDGTIEAVVDGLRARKLGRTRVQLGEGWLPGGGA